ncbi:hypothetical protein KP509_04G030700 [Ceratopteris richardii]|uniref:Acireductone dioxygenase n=1 Tax=Ceratopteris richardii TaxID=49495 RepID=A0A8T2UXY5_CERRI|nr:hypothetical protein KP509_04G030700 [Ceratopteris richardii]
MVRDSLKEFESETIAVNAQLDAWYINDSEEDQRLPHHLEPKLYVPVQKLAELGLAHWVLDSNNYEHDMELRKIRAERGYTYQDIVDIAPDLLPNYEANLKNFYKEHMHADEEIRFILAGSGYFDVRDFDDRWIRIWAKKNDMLVVPAGMYHRFTLDESEYIKALRLFKGYPVWTPHYRPQDEHPSRKDYITFWKRQ